MKSAPPRLMISPIDCFKLLVTTPMATTVVMPRLMPRTVRPVRTLWRKRFLRISAMNDISRSLSTSQRRRWDASSEGPMRLMDAGRRARLAFPPALPHGHAAVIVGGGRRLFNTQLEQDIGALDLVRRGVRGHRADRGVVRGRGPAADQAFTAAAVLVRNERVKRVAVVAAQVVAFRRGSLHEEEQPPAADDGSHGVYAKSRPAARCPGT